MSHTLFARDAVKRIVMTRLEVHYTPPVPAEIDGSENPAYRLLVNDFIDALTWYPESVLKRGMDAFLGEWSYARWPKIGELKRFMSRIQAEDQREEERQRPKLPPARPEVTEAERERVIGGFERLQHALRSGWADGMTDGEWYEWCKHGTLPEGFVPPTATELRRAEAGMPARRTDQLSDLRNMYAEAARQASSMEADEGLEAAFRFLWSICAVHDLAHEDMEAS